MPSSVQHGSTRPRATSSAPRRRAARGRASRDEGRLARRACEAGRGVAGCDGRRGHRDPPQVDAGDRRRPGAPASTTTQAVGVEVGRAGEPLGDRVGDRPAARRCGTGRRPPRARRAARGSRSQAPSSSRTGCDERARAVAGSRSARCTSSSPPAASSARRAMLAVLEGLVAEVDVHDAASSDRASRIRCISMLPEATVADTRVAPVVLDRPAERAPPSPSSRRRSATMSISTSALSWSSRVTAMR